MNRKITNPFPVFKSPEEYQCFGCSPYNKLGLKLEFFERNADEIGCWWKPEKHFEGFPQILHGGIHATLHDEIAGWLVYTKCKTSGVTKSISVDYLKPAIITENKMLLTAKLISTADNIATIETQLFSAEEVLCSKGEVRYFIFPEAVARRKYMYPGAEAFFNENSEKPDWQ